MRNEMTHRPIIKEELLDSTRTQRKELPGELGELEEGAHVAEVSVIPHETVVFLKFLPGQVQSGRILEIGAAVGFSSSVMTITIRENVHITTVDRFDVMIEKAREDYERLGLTDKVTLLKGQAADILPELSDPYDFIFMDSAESKCIGFLPECLCLLREGGVLVVNDIFQGRTILLPDEGIPRNKRAIHHKLNEFLCVMMNHPDLTSTILPLGDGIILMTRESEEIDL